MVEETFYLPYQASPYVLSFLFSACREIHRTFAHAPDHAVLHYLASQLLIGYVSCRVLVLRRWLSSDPCACPCTWCTECADTTGDWPMLPRCGSG
jgi:hypothetical protein